MSSRFALPRAGRVWGSAVLRRGDSPLVSSSKGRCLAWQVLAWLCAAEDRAGTGLEALLIPTGARNPAGSWWGWAEASLVFSWDPKAAWLCGILMAPWGCHVPGLGLLNGGVGWSAGAVLQPCSPPFFPAAGPQGAF